MATEIQVNEGRQLVMLIGALFDENENGVLSIMPPKEHDYLCFDKRLFDFFNAFTYTLCSDHTDEFGFRLSHKFNIDPVSQVFRTDLIYYAESKLVCFRQLLGGETFGLPAGETIEYGLGFYIDEYVPLMAGLRSIFESFFTSNAYNIPTLVPDIGE